MMPVALMSRRAEPWLLILAVASGCGTADETRGPGASGTTTASDPSACPAGEERFRGACVDPARRYEPEQRIDNDNVIAFGEPISMLSLPDPPKSGFRIIVP